MSWHQQLETGIAHLASHDPCLAELIKRYPQPTFRPHTDYYRELVSSIISQQLSVHAATAIYRRFIDSFGHVPKPHEILDRDDESLRATGLSRPKVRYIKDLAMHVLDGSVRFDQLDKLTNDEIVAELTAVKGVGEWTVHMYLIFCMGRLNVLPVGDLGVKNAIWKLYGLDALPTSDEVTAIAEQNSWSPYESIASWYLWRSLQNMPVSPSNHSK